MSELGDFLKAKRAQITPARVGLPAVGNPRRVEGLRREEVAQLAAVSVDHYTRLEQGRVVTASDSVLAGLARALRLTDDEHAYLRMLARPRPRPRPGTRPRTAHRGSRAPVAVAGPVRDLLDALGHTPAFVLGRRYDILAWNTAATALYLDFATLPPEHRNLVRLVFLEPRVRSLYADWEQVAEEAVARLRMNAVHSPDDPRLAALVGELSVRDDDFRRWWGGHAVRTPDAGRKRLRHPVAGDLALDWQALQLAAAPGQTLVTYTAAAGTPTHDALLFLRSWSAPAGRGGAEPTASRPPSRRDTERRDPGKPRDSKIEHVSE